MLDGLFPKVVCRGNSEFNKDIKVIKVGKTTKLMVDGIVQSINNDSRFAKRKVWGQVVKIISKEKPGAQRILLLGMGGGTMVHMLNKAFSNLDITSVGIDQVIVDLAYKYFGMDQSR